ncbi:FeoA family protein [Dapis sp. BLCC M229]|uniref:FeoA family protein n=1 Tax=Dapis sp. BLCC M229 TaxID=3400188 RepID=UPI003CFAAA73
MEKKYEDSLCKNVDKKEKAWEFTFLGDSSYISEKEKDHEVAQPSVAETNFPLTQAKRGDRLCIVAINAEGDMTRRLKKMGLVVGVELEVLSHNPSGSKIVAVERQNIGLGSNPARNIIVSSITTIGDSS